ncbi:unnamed protein product [Calypogeia fissa]
MVRAKSRSYKTKSGRRSSPYRRSSTYAAPSRSSSDRHSHNYGSSKMSIRRSSPRGGSGGRGRTQTRTRYSSIDSLSSRDTSYETLNRSPSKYSSPDMSRGGHRPPHYDRMVFEAIARLKSKKGSSIKDIAKNLENKYPEALKGKGKGTAEKIIATAKKLVKEGKLVKDGSHYRLTKTSSSRSSKGDYYYTDDDDSSPRSSHGSKRSSYSHRSSKRGRPRKRSRSRSESGSRSRSRSQSSPPRKERSYSDGSQRKKESRSYTTSTRRSGGRKRGAKRKKGPRKGQTRLAVGKRGPYRKKVSRARRRVKHSHTKRPKSEKPPDGDSSQSKGWFGGWFGGGTKTSQQGGDKGSSSKSETQKSKSGSERSGSDSGKT